jgi:hypothetical protein
MPVFRLFFIILVGGRNIFIVPHGLDWSWLPLPEKYDDSLFAARIN